MSRQKLRRNQQREDDDEDEVYRRHTRRGDNRNSVLNNVAMGALGTAVIGIGGYLLSKVFSSPKPAQTRYVTSSEECREALQRIREDLMEYPALGFDCQWRVNFESERSAIAVLQLATFKGRFVLIAMNKLNSFPAELREILRNRSIVKVGFEGTRDAEYLRHDYNLEVNSTFDLRYLAEDTANQPESLEGLSQSILGLKIRSDLEESNWDAETLEDDQLKYAELSVKACIDIFKTLMTFTNAACHSTQDIIKYCTPHFDRQYVPRSER